MIDKYYLTSASASAHLYNINLTRNHTCTKASKLEQSDISPNPSLPLSVNILFSFH